MLLRLPSLLSYFKKHLLTPPAADCALIWVLCLQVKQWIDLKAGYDYDQFQLERNSVTCKMYSWLPGNDPTFAQEPCCNPVNTEHPGAPNFSYTVFPSRTCCSQCIFCFKQQLFGVVCTLLHSVMLWFAWKCRQVVIFCILGCAWCSLKSALRLVSNDGIWDKTRHDI